MASYKPVTAALRVLEVLASVNRLYGRATVAAIHQQTGINKATIVRMLETLSEAGYVLRDADQPVYRITGKSLMLSAGFERHKVFAAIVAPLLDDFRKAIGWPSDVALFDHDAMLVIESSRQGGPLSFNRAPGYRAPVLGTSLGLAYIAHCQEGERARLLELVAKDEAPWNDLARAPDRLEETLTMIRSQGYATMDPHYSRQEYDNRIDSIGIAITSANTVFASINVIYLKSALNRETARDTLLGPLQKVADQMAEKLVAQSSDQS